jgi:hypothetical protein
MAEFHGQLCSMQTAFPLAPKTGRVLLIPSLGFKTDNSKKSPINVFGNFHQMLVAPILTSGY